MPGRLCLPTDTRTGRGLSGQKRSDDLRQSRTRRFGVKTKEVVWARLKMQWAGGSTV